MKQQLNNKVQYTRLLAARCTLTHGSFVLLDPRDPLLVLRCHIVINPQQGITSWRFLQLLFLPTPIERR
jgi:hypothetical protein